MRVEFRLKKILQDHGLDYFGVEKEIADYAKVHRHTIGKIYRNQANAISLKTLGQICDWLEGKGVPRSILPYGLFGASPSDLWSAIAKPGRVNIYLGEYVQTQTPAPGVRWISRRDARVESLIVRFLSASVASEHASPTIQTEYVPFRFGQESPNIRKQHFQEDIKKGKDIFGQMQKLSSYTSVILIGSQRVNYLLEYLVADIFHCEPFSSLKKPGSLVPIYNLYRDQDHAVPSCFGGLEKPAGYKGQVLPGIYFQNQDDQWSLFSWVEGKQCAGLVIVVYEPGTKCTQMAIFGFSGLSTEILGAKLVQDDNRSFWPPTAESKGKKIGIYVCRFVLSEGNASESGDHLRTDEVEIIPLSEKILKKYLH